MKQDNFNLIQCLTTQSGLARIIWMCNIGAEKHWHPIKSGVVDRQEETIVNRIEEVNLLLCREQDILILRQKPEDAFVDYMKHLGFAIPTILVPESNDPWTPIAELVIKDENLLAQLKDISQKSDSVYFVPYAVTPLEEQIAKMCCLRLLGSPSEIAAKVNDKIFSRKIAEALGFPVCQGSICSSLDEVENVCHKLFSEKGFHRVIVKEPYGASGKGLYLIEKTDNLQSKLRVIRRFSATNLFLVEGWQNKKYDVNYQIYISPQGEINVFSIKRQILRDTVYVGSQMPSGLGREYTKAYIEFGRKIGAYLFKLGYTGIAGVDSIIDEKDTLFPIIEINGRFTLSTYLSFLNRYFGENEILARYFRLAGKTAVRHTEVIASLRKAGLAFQKEKQEGVVVYAAGPLSPDLQGDYDYKGRLFAIITAKNLNRLDWLTKRLEIWSEPLSARNKSV